MFCSTFILGKYGFPYHKSEKITIAKRLNQKGITKQNIISFKYIGNETSYTSGLVFTENNKKTIAWMWDRYFETAEPYSFRTPSGNTKIEIYTKNTKGPAAVLRVNNDTDATTIIGDEGSYMCYLLGNHIIKELKSNEAASPNGETTDANSP